MASERDNLHFQKKKLPQDSLKSQRLSWRLSQEFVEDFQRSSLKSSSLAYSLPRTSLETSPGVPWRRPLRLSQDFPEVSMTSLKTVLGLPWSAHDFHKDPLEISMKNFPGLIEVPRAFLKISPGFPWSSQNFPQNFPRNSLKTEVHSTSLNTTPELPWSTYDLSDDFPRTALNRSPKLPWRYPQDCHEKISRTLWRLP